MKYLAAIPTYQRPNVLRRCIETLFNGANRPAETWFLDDGSDPAIREALLELQIVHSHPDSPINLVLWGQNMGIGYNFEAVYEVFRMRNFPIMAVIESDYIWRKNFFQDVEAIYEADPYVIGLAGCDHPDMYQREKTHDLFPRLMMEQFPTDVVGRQYMYEPFKLETKRGVIEVFGVSNSCGCMFIFWERFQNILKELNAEGEYWNWMERAFNKQPGGNRRNASDQHMSCTVTWYWYQWAIKQNLDLKKHFPLLNVADYSLSSHICGGGVNAGICPEMSTFVGAPHWKDEYTQIDPRENYVQTV